MATHTEEWFSIAEQVSVEMDRAKLRTLVEQLCSALDSRRQGILPVMSVSHKDDY